MSASLPFAAGGGPAAPGPAATVLIVTPDKDLRDRLQDALARAGLTGLTAGSGQAALEPLGRGGVDLLLIDLPLPDGPAQGLLERQRKAERPVPFVALVAPGEERLGLESMRWGALDCLVKDAQFLERLPSALERFVRQWQLAADLAAMNRLHELSARLLKTADLHELLAETLEATVSLQGADFGSVQLYNRRSGALELVAQWGFRAEDALKPFRVMLEGAAACGLALQRRQRVVIEDTEADPVYAPYRVMATAAGFRAVQSTPMFSRDGEPLGVLSTFFRRPHRPPGRALRLTDLYVGQAAGLIERQQTEEALRASEARYRALVHATSAAVWRLSADGERQLSLEGSFVRERREPEARPGDWLSLVHPEDRARTLEAWRRAVATQSLYEIEHRGLAADGGYRCLLARGVPVRGAGGEVLEWIGASADVTERKRAEAALRKSEERYRRVSESGFISIAFFTTDGRITEANDAFLQLVGFSRQELAAGRVRWDQLTPPEWLARTRQALEEFKAIGRVSPYEKEYFRRDGSRFWGLFGSAKLEGGSDEGVAFVLDITERKQLEQEVLEISGREQRRIGHDLHDDLCQRLGGLQLLSGVLEKDLAAEGSPRAAQAGQLLARVQEALERARRLARGLAPVDLEGGGLVTALQELAENSSQLFRIQCQFWADAPVAVADAGTATHLYRIAQEAISNAVRHGRACRVNLGLHRTEEGFELNVRDDGRGFSPLVSTPGMGLRIMRYRAGMIGAVLEVRSAPGAGTAVTCAFSAGRAAQRVVPGTVRGAGETRVK